MPTCLTDDEYLERMNGFFMFTLCVALRYNCNYSYWACFQTTYMEKLYIEMKDGSIVGKNILMMRDGIRSGTSRMGWLGGSVTGEPFTFRWLLPNQ